MLVLEYIDFKLNIKSLIDFTSLFLPNNLIEIIFFKFLKVYPKVRKIKTFKPVSLMLNLL